MSEPLRPSFATVLENLWRERHTGPVTIHFAEGHAQTVEIPQEPLLIRLDTRAPTRADLTQN